MKLIDSGSRSQCASGAVRDMQAGKGRFDLMLSNYDVLLGLAQLFEAGAEKYADRNWERGMDAKFFANSAARHQLKYLAGYRDEPHAIQWLWNVFCLGQTESWIAQGRLPIELWNLPAPKPKSETPPAAWEGLTHERYQELIEGLEKS